MVYGCSRYKFIRKKQPLNHMLCCPEIIVPFNGVAETVVPYSGTSPLIQMVYSVGGQLIAQGVFTNWTLSAGTITFDHGGVASGFIKIS